MIRLLKLELVLGLEVKVKTICKTVTYFTFLIVLKYFNVYITKTSAQM